MNVSVKGGIGPYVIYSGVDDITGADIDIMKILAERLNLKLSFKREKVWGVKSSNGTWSGLLGKVSRGESDIGLGHIVLNSVRYSAVDYVILYDFNIHLFSPKPQPLPRYAMVNTCVHCNLISNLFRYLNLAKPFRVTVWVCALIILVVVMVLSPALFMLYFKDKNSSYQDAGRTALAMFGSQLGESSKFSSPKVLKTWSASAKNLNVLHGPQGGLVP